MSTSLRRARMVTSRTTRNALRVAALLAFSAQASAAIPLSERQVLLDLYSQTDGANWTNNTGWNGAEGSECTWYGVACDGSEQHVTTVSLAGNHLVGTLPSNLNDLTALQIFSVRDNQLSGPIPVLDGLNALRHLDFGFNQLTGSIPDLAAFPNLTTFIAMWNQLTGSIPSLQGNPQLGIFNVDENQLSGTIPALTGLTQLQVFSVQSNQLSGNIPALTGLTSLQYLGLSANQLDGPLPSFEGLSAVEWIQASGNQLSGSIPPLTGLNALLSLDVRNNQLVGDAPAVPSPSALMAGHSGLCPNLLNPSIGSANDLAWDVATGLTPWSQGCTAAPITLSITDASLIEGNSGSTLMHFTVSLSSSPAAAVTVDWYTSSGTATPGPDYNGGTGSLSWSVGDGSPQTIDIEILGDTDIEADEDFSVILQNAVGASLADASATGTIINDDNTALPLLTINDVSAVEADAGTTGFAFTIALSAAPSAPVSVTWATADGSATAASGDYASSTATASWNTGDNTPRTITVFVNGDTDIELDETFSVQLSNASGATIADGSGAGTILNDDAAALPSLTINDVSTVEGDAGTTGFAFTIALSAAPPAPVSVTWATADGSATAASGDYASGTATASWNAGDSAPRTITVFVNGDTDIELDETFSVQLSNANGATIADGTGTGTIQDDDTPIGVAPQITSPTPPNATVGVPYHFVVTATGTPVPSFADVGLPAGLTIDAVSGLISGTPTAPGTSHVFIIADNGVRPDALQEFDMTVSGQPTANVHRVPMLSPFNLLLLMLVLPFMAMRALTRR